MYVLTIYLMQAQAGGWTSTNECKQKLNKHKWPKWARMRANEHEWEWAEVKRAQPGSGDKHQHKQPQASTSEGQTIATGCQGQMRVGEREGVNMNKGGRVRMKAGEQWQQQQQQQLQQWVLPPILIFFNNFIFHLVSMNGSHLLISPPP